MSRGYQGNNNVLLLVKLRHSNYVFAKVIVLPFNHAIVIVCDFSVNDAEDCFCNLLESYLFVRLMYKITHL
jgi:hypothetical protein